MSDRRATPLLGDIPLDFGQVIEHSVDAGFVPLRIAGLDGELQQRLSRRGHHVRICGYLIGSEATAQLEQLQKAAMAGSELTFASDITTALELKQVVIAALHTSALAGEVGKYGYDIRIAESPPLPPPAQLSAFGGLDDFGLGDLGFDTDVLGDIADLAGDIAGAVDDALDVVDQLGALAALGALAGSGDLEIGGLLDPLRAPTDALSDIATDFTSAIETLGAAFSRP